MYVRPGYVTNSSSTSILGFGVTLTRSEWTSFMQSCNNTLPEGVDYAYPPSGDRIVYVELPPIDMSADGLLIYPDPACIQKPMQELQRLLGAAGIDDSLEYIEESWYNG